MPLRVVGIAVFAAFLTAWLNRLRGCRPFAAASTATREYGHRVSWHCPPSAFKAAANATGRLITLCSGGPACVRVSEIGMRRSFTYTYCG